MNNTNSAAHTTKACGLEAIIGSLAFQRLDTLEPEGLSPNTLEGNAMFHGTTYHGGLWIALKGTARYFELIRRASHEIVKEFSHDDKEYSVIYSPGRPT